MNNTVLKTTVASGFCCGCGVCAGICPSHSLKMEFNEYGELHPIRIADCKKTCGLCVKVCPFMDGNTNEDDIGKKIFSDIPLIRHRPETGYYLCSGVGAVSDESARMVSSSGGLATWFLVQLLEMNMVDAVICANSKLAREGEKLFEYYIAHSPSEVKSATGSVYYPLEISEVLQYIRKNDGRYAIIGLPCVLKGIRLAQNYSSVLNERIVCLVGLSCSNLKSSKFTEYAAWYSGLDEIITSCSYRNKTYSQTNKFFNCKFTGINGSYTEQYWGGGEKLWNMYFERCFTLHSCDCCDDMFAECADITFMDAWLPEYADEPRGTSIYIARTPLSRDLLLNGVNDGLLDVSDLSIERVIQSQSSLRWKREMLKYRLHLMKERGEKVPEKRVSPERGSLNFIEREMVEKALYIQRESRLRSLDSFEEITKWFDTAHKDRPVFICLYYYMSTIPAMVYQKLYCYPNVQKMMRKVKYNLKL